MKFKLWRHNLFIINASFSKTTKDREKGRIHISSCFNILVFGAQFKQRLMVSVLIVEVDFKY
jgi:hypothetical protein